MGSPEDIAQASAKAMWADDNACKGMDMRVLEVGPGFSRMDMMVAPHMTNGHGTCHGGFIFSLADSAFAYACNSYGQRAVAQHCTITYVAPGRQGSRLTADARERSRTDRSGIYDVTVRDEAGTVIAEFRGHSRTLPGSLLEPKKG